MALEPALALLLGLIVLSQQPSPVQMARHRRRRRRAGAQRGGLRPTPTGTTPEPALARVTTTPHQEPG